MHHVKTGDLFVSNFNEIEIKDSRTDYGSTQVECFFFLFFHEKEVENLLPCATTKALLQYAQTQ